MVATHLRSLLGGITNSESSYQILLWEIKRIKWFLRLTPPCPDYVLDRPFKTTTLIFLTLVQF